MTERDALNVLLAALKELRIRAGKPSCRKIAKACTVDNETSISHGTVALVFKQLQRLEHVLLVVKYLNGDQDRFKELWAAAKIEEEEASVQARQRYAEAESAAQQIIEGARLEADRIRADATAVEKEITDHRRELEQTKTEIAHAREQLAQLTLSIQNAQDQLAKRESDWEDRNWYGPTG
jgi:hypothetical protein